MGHHSITDWDFESVNWTLDGAVYHTAAPSLSATEQLAALVKDATTGALSNGRLILWVRSNEISLLGMYFRNQIADGGADAVDTYYADITATTCRLFCFGNSFSETKDMTWVWAVNTWYKLRFSWWTSAERLYFRIERWTGAAWVTLGGDADTDFEDVNDHYKDNPVNRCGVRLLDDLWIDDLEVWG
ncbi:unnamed protein product [marine sediment metagenome]|uniref:Uncharacterized protein n=1 Tax=marine sediment metagenome TaxID=412755 RepID=X1LJF4_9ZZZZ